jgi:hypothetical protein
MGGWMRGVIAGLFVEEPPAARRSRKAAGKA